MKRLSELYRRNTYFVVLFASYLALLACTLLLGSVFHLNTLANTRRATRQQHDVVLTQSAMVVDSYLSSVRSDLLHIAKNTYAVQVSKMNAPRVSQEYYTAHQLSMFLSKQTTNNPAFLGSYVYYNNLNAVFTPQGKYAAEIFFKDLYGVDRDVMAEERLLIQSHYFNEALPARFTEDTPGGVIPVVQSIPVSGPDSPRAAAVAHIGVEALRHIFARFIHTGNASIYIYDQKDRFIATISDNVDAWCPPDAPLTENTGDLVRIHNEQQIVSRFVSQESGWQYVTAVPERVALKNVYEQWDLLLLLLAAELLIGVALSYLLAKGAFSPISRFKRRFPLLLEADNGYKNEFLHIEKMMESSMIEKENMRVKIDHYKPILASHVLMQIMTGSFSEPDKLVQMAQDYGIHLCTPEKIAVILHVGSTSAFFNADLFVELATIKFVMINVLEDLLSPYFTVYACEVNLTDVALLLGAHAWEEAERATLGQVCAYVHTFMVENFGAQVYAGAGKAYAELRQIGLSYRQAQQATASAVVKRADYLCLSEEEAPLQYTPFMFDRFEEMLKNLIRAQETQKALECVDDACGLSVDTSLPAQLVQCHFFGLLSVAIHLTTDAEICAGMNEETCAAIAKRLVQCSAFDELREVLRTFVEQTCAICHSGKKTHPEMLRDRITALIDQEYSNANLCLTFIAQEMSMNASYLSAFFKKQTGQNLTDYISSVRMCHAKALLTTTCLDISHIAACVGYSSYNALIRAFKKESGVTPGQYRDIYAPH